jgi:hypothetical protein
MSRCLVAHQESCPPQADWMDGGFSLRLATPPYASSRCAGLASGGPLRITDMRKHLLQNHKTRGTALEWVMKWTLAVGFSADRSPLDGKGQPKG